MSIGEASEDISLVYPSEYANGKTATGTMFAQILRGEFSLINKTTNHLAATTNSIDMMSFLEPNTPVETVLNNAAYTTLYEWSVYVPKGATRLYAFVAWRVLTTATITHRLVANDGTHTDTGTDFVTVNTTGASVADVFSTIEVSIASIGSAQYTKSGNEEDAYSVLKPWHPLGKFEKWNTFSTSNPRLSPYDESNIQAAWISVELSTLTKDAISWVKVESKGLSSASAGSTSASIIPVYSMCRWE